MEGKMNIDTTWVSTATIMGHFRKTNGLFLVHLVFFSPLVFLEEKWVREMKSDLPVGPLTTTSTGRKRG